MESVTVLQTILGGAVGSSIVVGIFGLITWFLNRKAAKTDKKEAQKEKREGQARTEMDNIKGTLDNLIIAMRMQMYLSIKRDGRSYLDRGSITAEELGDLIQAHSVYHDVLEGNGYLDTLMEKVKELPVKNEKR